MSEKINVEFTFEELAGLYFIATAGFVSIVLQNTATDDPNYTQVENEWRSQILNIREAGNYTDIVAKVEAIREILAVEAPKRTERSE